MKTPSPPADHGCCRPRAGKLGLSGFVAALALSAVVPAGCHTEDFGPCFPEMKIGDRIEVTVLEKWDEQSQYQGGLERPNCGYDQDLPPGAVVEFQVVGHYERSNASCDYVMGSAALAGASLSAPSSLPRFGPDAAVQASYYATLADRCAGRWYVAVIQPEGSAGIFAPAVPGEVPPVVLARIFAPDPNITCPAAMGEERSACSFVATAKRLP
jgi:hypothetical protein